MLKMILVDDEKIIRETISSVIDWKALGIDVVAVCKDGIEAFDAIVDEYPDIVMTDIKMPGLDGLELIEKVREAELNVEFVILSGYGEFEFAQTAMRYGVQHYLLKPCNEDEIVKVIEKCVKNCQDNIVARLEELIVRLTFKKQQEDREILGKIKALMCSQQDAEIAKMLLLKLLMKGMKHDSCPLTKSQMTEYIVALNGCIGMDQLMKEMERIFHTLFPTETQRRHIDCVDKVVEYVLGHLSDSNLSLKWIAENYLYMNADYVSKQFVKQTGLKFSAYLTNLRIAEAKKLLLDVQLESPYAVAEKVGFGNNPQYFSQIFKKSTGMTPSAYIKEKGNW